MKVTELFDKGEFVITSEIGPVKGCLRRGPDEKLPQCVQEAEEVKDYVHAINVTDNQSAVMRLGSIDASVKLKEKAIEITIDLIEKIAPMVQGIHFMPLGWADIIPEIV